MNKKTKIITVIVLAIILVLAGYFVSLREISRRESYKNLSTENAQPELTNKPEVSIKKPTPEIGTILTGFKLYKNINFGFEIQYPDSWAVSEEDIVNVRGENTKGFFFKKPNSDLRFAILPRDGLSYGLPNEGTSENINISGFMGVQTKYIMPDGRRLLLVHPQTNIFNWDQEIGRLDIESSVEDPVGDFVIFNKMLNSFKLSK